MSGGSEKSSSSSQSKSYTPKQEQWLGKALDVYGPQIGQGENIFQGKRIAEFSPYQNQAMTQAQGWLNSFSPKNGMPLFGETGNALQQILAGQGGAPLLSLDAANQTFSKNYFEPAMRTFKRDIAPAIQEQYAGPGYWSTARAGAVADAASDLGEQLESERAKFLWDTETANRELQEAAASRMLTGVSQGIQYGAMPAQWASNNLSGIQSIFDFGTAEQQQRQNQINAQIQQFAEQNRLTSQEDMAILLALLGMNYSTSESSGSGSGWKISLG